MDSFILFWLAIFLGIILLITAIIFLFYWIPKKLGRKKLGIWLSAIVSTIILGFILSIVFEEELFFKSDAAKLLNEHDIALTDDFKITSNEMTGLMDYYHRFEITISEKDKNNLIKKFLTSEKYQLNVPEDFNLRHGKPRYADTDTTYTIFYQKENNYVYEFYQPHKPGYAPTWDIITIRQRSNKLIFERIID